MLNLIKKDILIQKRTVISLILFVVVCLFTNQGKSSTFNSYFIAVTIAYVLAVGSLGYDEKFKGDMVVNSLPVTRKEVIISKYIGVIVFTVISIIFINILSIVINLLNISIIKLYPITLKQFKSVMYSCVILTSIIIPVFIKYGISKGRIINFILYMSFFSLTSSITTISQQKNIASIFKIFNNNLGILILICCIYLLSMKLSLKVYLQKDF